MHGPKFWTATVVAFAVFFLTPIVSGVAFYDIVVFFRDGLDATVSQTLTDYFEGTGFTGAGILWGGVACLWTCGLTLLAYHFLGWWMLPTQTRKLIHQALTQAEVMQIESIARPLRRAIERDRR